MYAAPISELSVPSFLHVDAAESAARRAWAAVHPVVANTFSGKTDVERRAVDEARERVRTEQKESERQRLQALRDRKREEAVGETQGQYVKRLPGTVWNSRVNRWTSPYYMSAAKFERLMAEMPTDTHRSMLTKLHGSGHGASLGAGVLLARATKDASTLRSTPAGALAKTRSADKGAGRVRVPSEPRGTSPTTAASSTTKPPRAPAAAPVQRPGGDWKTGVIALLSRPEGATTAEIGAAYGWLEKSASARLSGIRKERTIVTTAEERGRVHRLEVTT